MEKINNNLFKLTMSKYATGVTIVTINKKKLFLGKTVNSFASLSLTPPLVLFSLDKKSSSINDFKKTKYLGINLLSNKQKNLSKFFSMNKALWGNTPFFLSKNKTPLIRDCLANIDCEKIKLINQGDHIIFICKIKFVKINKKIKPLIYVNSQYI
jgi:flavin reductase (DIM6/NTAB) family NADH-FMN oxidoreductase RutF